VTLKSLGAPSTALPPPAAVADHALHLCGELGTLELTQGHEDVALGLDPSLGVAPATFAASATTDGGSQRLEKSPCETLTVVTPEDILGFDVLHQ
jgi:hypothetical protein